MRKFLPIAIISLLITSCNHTKPKAGPTGPTFPPITQGNTFPSGCIRDQVVTVDAGEDKTIRSTIPSLFSAQLEGTANAVGVCSPGFFARSWSVESSPANSIVSFDDSTEPDTIVRLNKLGTYIFKLESESWTGTGHSKASDEVTITAREAVHQLPD